MEPDISAETASDTGSEPTSSFMVRAASVFSSPSELYGEIAAAPVQTSSWLIPFILTVLVTMLTVVVMYFNPELHAQMLEPGREALHQQVAAGKMSQDDADRAEQFMDSPIILVTGMGGAALFTAAMTFFVPLLLLFVVQVLLQTPAAYKKMLEAYGISMMIGLLGGIIGILMISQFNSLRAAPAASLFIMNSFDPHNVAHRFLAAINFFTAWQVIVLGIGAARFARRPASVGIGMTMGLWVLLIVVFVMAGWGMR